MAPALGFFVSLTGQKKDDVLAFSLLFIISISFVLFALGLGSPLILYCISFYIGGYIFGKFYLNHQRQKDAMINKNKKSIAMKNSN